jgi:hypothetical protein
MPNSVDYDSWDVATLIVIPENEVTKNYNTDYTRYRYG